ncbi:MAG: 2-hydroxyacyl-CoA dehydratase [Clostridia bacterium]|nr:MAG: 2-hydroxyacyl-CoA dehydratase [Clostridia bacterium]
MSSTLDTLNEFREVNAAFPYAEPVREWKKQGGKVIGWLCSYVPEEMLHAAGVLPVRVTGGYGELALEEATAYLGVMLCSFARSCLQLAIDQKYEFLDALVGVATCEGSRHLAEVWEHYIKTPLLDILPLPHKMHQRAEEFFAEELRRFKLRLEEFLQVEITDSALWGSVALYNKHREISRQLYELRKADYPPLSGTEVLEVMNASVMMPKEQANAMLERLLTEAKASGRAVKGSVRLMLSGSILNNPQFVAAIEDLGGIVVVDELCTGLRYWCDMVETDGHPDPVVALARRYMTKFPCARMNPFSERLNRLLPLISEYRVEGVITRAIRYCKPYIQEQHMLKTELENRGVPVLDLDVEYGMPGTGQVRTRVQAFIEMLLERRKAS